MTDELMKLADDYATKTADFARNIFCSSADSMSPIAVQAGDARMALQTALEALIQQPKVIQVMGLNVVLDPMMPPDTMKLVQHCKAQAAEIERLTKENEGLQSTPFSEEAYEILQGENRKLQAKLDAAQAQEPHVIYEHLPNIHMVGPNDGGTRMFRALKPVSDGQVFYASPVVQQPLTDERTYSAGIELERRNAELQAENKQLAEFVVAVGGFWGDSKSVLTGENSLAEVIQAAHTKLIALDMQKPMTDKQIADLFYSNKAALGQLVGGSAEVPAYRKHIVRMIEAAHGIGGQQP